MRFEDSFHSVTEAIQLGLEHHKAGRLPDAERIYQRVLQGDPDNPDALHLLGVIAHQVGKNEVSVQLIDRAIHRDPSNAPFLNNRGLALLELKRAQEALASYDLALAIKPDYVDAWSNRGLALHAMQRYDEALASYGKALAINPGNPVALSNCGNALQELDRHEEALANYDKALAINAVNAEPLSNRGLALFNLKRHDDALASFDKALKIKPAYAEAWGGRGIALQALGRYDEALASFDNALAIKPDYAEAFNHRGHVLHKLNRRDEALASYDKALAIRPTYLEALSNRGLALQALRRCDEALASYDKALAIKPDYAVAHWNESLCRLLMGDFEIGWKKYEWRWKNEKLAHAPRNFSQPLWLGGEDIAGKTILLHAEQGLGDTIQFARYAGTIARRGATVILEVQPVLKPLLSNISDGCRVLSRGEPLPAFDFHCPLLSLPLAVGTRVETIPAAVPYLSARKAGIVTWRENLSVRDTLLVGVCWKGNPGYEGDHERSLRLAELRPLLALPNVRFVSLQKELDKDEQALAPDLENFVHPGVDFRQTAEMIGALDLVISVDTAWAHWAGAIGKPLWVLLPHAPHWCWLLDRDDSPWYPSARLFRQSRSGDWPQVIQAVVQALRSQ